MTSSVEGRGCRARLPIVAAILLATAATPGFAAHSRRGDRIGSPAAIVVDVQEQIARGKAAYAQNCSPCHRSDLAGDQSAPALVGEAFAGRWMGQSVGDLFDNVRTGMPADNPGGLNDDTFLDIVVYILQQNNYPLGGEELKADRDVLKKLTITTK